MNARLRMLEAGSALLALSVLSCAMQSKVRVDVQKPAAVHLSGVRKIAVADLRGPMSSGPAMASLVQSMLMETGFYQLVERDKIAGILDEQKLAQAGVTDESTAKEVGQLLGADALVFGEITTYGVEPDETGSEKIEKKEGTGKYETVEEKNIFTGKKHKVRKEIKRTVWVDQYYRIRRGTVAVNFRVADVETGKLLAVHSDSKSYNSGKVVEGSGTSLKPEGEILNDLSTQVAKGFVQLIAPHRVTETRAIESGSGKIGEGKKFAQSGLWQDAFESWQEAVRLTPNESAAHYDLGLAFEVRGDLDEAEKAIRKAVSIKQKKTYLEALARVLREKDEKVRLEEQLKGRQP
jgi:curli biogenesis system outer membrane secretion channel CsgG